MATRPARGSESCQRSAVSSEWGIWVFSGVI